MTTAALGYRPALDGVRGVAVLAVLLLHSGLLGGGYLGVDIFFALSGFLITSLLAEEYARTGAITLRLFYARRALRLLPALLVLVAVCTPSLLAARPEYRTLVLQETALVLLYVANYAWAFGIPMWVYNHMWSLGIDEQFYVLWPLALLGLLRAVRGQRAIAALVLVAAAAGVAWRLVLVHAHAVAERYAGLDAGGSGLLFGCAASLLLVGTGARGGGGVRAAGLVGVAGLAVLIWRAPFSNEYLARLSSPLGALAATLIIVYVVHERASWLARGLAVPPLAALGRISYGVYLWHFPAFYWAGVLTANSWPAVVLGWAATLAAAGASYAIVERPALAFKATLRPGRGQRGS